MTIGSLRKVFLNVNYSKNSIARQSSFNVIARIGSSFISLAFIKYFSTSFSLAEMGIYAVLDISMTFLSMVSNFGLNQSLVRYIPEYLKEQNMGRIKELISTFLSFTFLINLFIILLLLWNSNGISHIFFDNRESSGYVLAILLYSFINFYTNATILTYQGLGDFTRAAIFNFLNVLLPRITAIILIFYGFGLKGVFVGFIIGSAVVLIISSRALLKYIHPMYVNFSIVKKSLPYYLESFTRYGYAQADLFIVAGIFSNQILGAFFVISKIISLFKLVIDAFMEPVINQLIKSTDEQQYIILFKKACFIVFLICISALILFYLGGNHILHLLSDTTYSEFKDLLLLYSIPSLLLYYIYNMAGIHILIKYPPRFTFYLSVLLCIFVLSFELCLGYNIGVTGVPIGQIIGFLSLLLLLLLFKSNRNKNNV